MSRKRALIAGWVLLLGLSATLPFSLVFHGIVRVGPGSTVANKGLDKPLIALLADVDLPRGTRSMVLDIGGSVHLQGRASDDLVSLGGAIYLGRHSHVDGDVLAIPGSIYQASGASVAGRLGGAVHVWAGEPAPARPGAGQLAARNVRLALAAGLALLLVGICLTVVFPWQVVLIATTLNRAPVKSVAAGLTNMLIFVFLVVPLGLSLVGLPFALLLAGAAFLAWLFGLTAFAVVLGRFVVRGRVPLISATGFGLLLLACVLAIPLLGALAIAAVGLAGTGALAVALLSRSAPPAAV